MDLGGVCGGKSRRNCEQVQAYKYRTTVTVRKKNGKWLRFFKCWYAIGHIIIFKRYGNIILTLTVISYLDKIPQYP